VKYQKPERCNKVLRVDVELRRYLTRETGVNVYMDGRHAFSRALGLQDLPVSEPQLEARLYIVIELSTFETLFWCTATSPPSTWSEVPVIQAAVKPSGSGAPKAQYGKLT
jgi:hypothetical protein